MQKIIFNKTRFIIIGLILIAISCVKDNTPADCTKPANPTVVKGFTVNQGGSIQLSASGVNGAKYSWSGPHSFSYDGTNPVINNANIYNSGNYWVKAQVGYCYSDSVSVNVFVKSDSTCNLGDNGADFPNGSSGPFTMHSACSTGANNTYQINSSNADSSLLITIILKQKPQVGGAYTLTDNPSPADNEVFYQAQGSVGGNFYSKGNIAYVKVKNGQVNVIICSTNFAGLGVLSANITCK